MRCALVSLLVATTSLVAQVVAPVASIKQLRQQADRLFFQKEDMRAAEGIYRKIMAHADATRAQRSDAHRYACACVARRGEIARAVELQAEWLQRYPKHAKRHYTLFFQGIYLRQLGREAAARRAWQTVLDEDPRSSIAGRVRLELQRDRPGSPRSHPKPRRYRPGRSLAPAAPGGGGYLVVQLGTLSAGFRRIAERAARFHRGAMCAHRDLGATRFERSLRTDLQSRRPKSVLFVVSPEVLDVNLHRRILMISTAMDADPFPDFAFGYLVARDEVALSQLWERTERMHREGLASNRWHSASVASSIKATRYPGGIDAHARAAGFRGTQFYFGTSAKESDPVRAAQRFLTELQDAAVLTMTGCGDPQGTWLFDDQRNRDRSKHWQYEPGLVGQDPRGEMPRLTAKEFRRLRLPGSVVWSGVCHAGAMRRVWVEGDIVATFGKTEHATLHEQSLADSLSLAWIDAGATALLFPIGANHGFSVSREVQFALGNGASLGAALKSTYDDVCLAAGGALKLGIQVHGQPVDEPEPVMQGGGANRLLLGDPALAPFRRASDPRGSVRVQRRDRDRFDVLVHWRKGLHPRGWDMYGTDRQRDWSVRARVDVTDLAAADRRVAFRASVTGRDASGRSIPYVMTFAEPEAFHGRRYLHLQANVARKLASQKEVRVRFAVVMQSRWRR